MLPDPLVSNVYGSAVASVPAGTVCNFRKIGPGKTISIDGPFTADTPCFLSIRQRTRKYGTVKLTPSDFTVRGEHHFNVAPVNGVPQDDIPLIVEVRILSYPQFHSVPSLQSLLNVVLQQTQNNLARLQSGEGI